MANLSQRLSDLESRIEKLEQPTDTRVLYEDPDPDPLYPAQKERSTTMLREYLTPTRISAMLAFLAGLLLVVLGYILGDTTLQAFGYGAIGGSGLTVALPPSVERPLSRQPNEDDI